MHGNKKQNKTIDENVTKAMDDLCIEVEKYVLDRDEEEALRVLRSMPRRRRRQYLDELPSFIGQKEITGPEGVRKELDVLQRVAWHPDHGIGHMCHEDRGIIMDRILQLKEMLAPSHIHGEADDEDAHIGGTKEIQGTTVQKTTTFLDDEPIKVLDMSSPMDITRSVADHWDLVSLGDYLKRPRLIQQISWTTTAISVNSPPPGVFANTVQINPWDAFMQDTITSKINNFRNFKCDGMRVEFRVNGTIFHYGLVRASYVPGPKYMVPYDNMRNPYDNTVAVTNCGTLNGFQLGLKTHWSQYPGVFIDTAANSVTEFTVPYFNPMNYSSVVANFQIGDLGRFLLWVINPLLHSNGATDPVSISVYAWLINPVLTVPTRSAAYVGEADEYKYDGAVSRPASALARFAGKLTDVPVIGPYATATKMMASRLASVANIFGFSRPLQIERPIFVNQRPYGPMAVTSGTDTALKLTLDPKQEITVDPRVVGLPPDDEMSFAHITQRESLILQFPWATTDQKNTNLAHLLVHPGARPAKVATPEIDFHTALSWAVLPFTYWTGSLKYRIQIVASQVHRGRLAVVYNPNRAANITSLPDTACTYQHVIDLSLCRDYTFVVQYAHPNPWLETAGLNQVAAKGDANVFGSDSALCANGILSIYVNNELAAPINTSTVTINIWVSAGDDFQMAVPGGFGNMDHMSPFSQAIRAAYTSESLEGVTGDEEPIVGEASEHNHNNMNPNERGASTGSMCIVLNGNDGLKMTPEHYNTVFIGEQNVSLRALIKRYCLYHRYNYSLTSGPDVSIGQAHAHIPQWPGNSTTAGSLVVNPNWNMGTADGSNGFANYCKNTFLSYYRIGFAAYRGNVRYKYILHGTALSTGNCGAIWVSRDTRRITDEEDLFIHTEYNNPLGAVAATDDVKNVTMYNDPNFQQQFSGAELEFVLLKNGIEFEHPYYSPQRFTYTFQRPRPIINNSNSIVEYQALPIVRSRHRVTFMLTGTTHQLPLGAFMSSYVAAGEDFSLHYFGAAPVMGRFAPIT